MTKTRTLFLPRADNFLVLMILAANSKPVDFCTHLRTTEKAPLKKEEQRHYFPQLTALIDTILICSSARLFSVNSFAALTCLLNGASLRFEVQLEKYEQFNIKYFKGFLRTYIGAS
jgi:hypothetical protein